MRLKVLVQSCPQRAAALGRTMASVQASDIGRADSSEVATEVFVHPKELGAPTPTHDQLRQFLIRVLRAGYESEARFVLRLEDDVVVNERIVQNALSWPALDEPNFGAGWLFVPKAVWTDYARLGRGTHSGCPYRDSRDMHAAMAVLMERSFVGKVIERLEMETWNDDGTGAQDISISRAVWDRQRRIYLHSPSLAEGLADEPSTRGHEAPEEQRLALDTFDPKFLRV